MLVALITEEYRMNTIEKSQLYADDPSATSANKAAKRPQSLLDLQKIAFARRMIEIQNQMAEVQKKK